MLLKYPKRERFLCNICIIKCVLGHERLERESDRQRRGERMVTNFVINLNLDYCETELCNVCSLMIPEIPDNKFVGLQFTTY